MEDEFCPHFKHRPSQDSHFPDSRIRRAKDQRIIHSMTKNEGTSKYMTSYNSASSCRQPINNLGHYMYDGSGNLAPQIDHRQFIPGTYMSFYIFKGFSIYPKLVIANGFLNHQQWLADQIPIFVVILSEGVQVQPLMTTMSGESLHEVFGSPHLPWSSMYGILYLATFTIKINQM